MHHTNGVRVQSGMTTLAVIHGVSCPDTRVEWIQVAQDKAQLSSVPSFFITAHENFGQLRFYP
jgi:hypothetical protein